MIFIHKHFMSLFILLIIITEILLLFIGVSALRSMLITLIIAMTFWFVLWRFTYGKITAYLEDECDPLKYIEACRNLGYIHKSAKYLNDLNLSLVVGYMELGAYDDVTNCLQSYKLSPTSPEITISTYHQIYMAYYISTKDFDSARLEYDKLKATIYDEPKFYRIRELSLYNYYLLEYMSNKTQETAKTYYECAQSLYETPRKTKRVRLALLYGMASVESEFGNKEKAVEMYKTIVEQGNKLHIVELSKKAIKELASEV